ncbi:hypothetical protein QEH56_14760 [Pelagicoccus enzymogenes]|uniref:hypothetical protein n=1 Tax=Pelagicoccus enzymogenes TaxID=2773457 RepID=UPI00280E16AD|nr:hypothetical protein [Pelagicoccus enzymogenes]MDQ8199425.1 hypothetical protein [Pelagicoccus enzymogenes]
MNAITCPACFAKEIDPVFLRRDPTNSELYCLKCSYTAASDSVVKEFFDSLKKHRYSNDEAGRKKDED